MAVLRKLPEAFVSAWEASNNYHHVNPLSIGKSFPATPFVLAHLSLVLGHFRKHPFSSGIHSSTTRLADYLYRLDRHTQACISRKRTHLVAILLRCSTTGNCDRHCVGLRSLLSGSSLRNHHCCAARAQFSCGQPALQSFVFSRSVRTLSVGE